MMAGNSLHRVTMDDYNTEVRPGNQLDKASHVERGPIYAPLLLTVSQRPPPLLTVSRLAFPILECPNRTTVFPTARGV